jgi:membrane protein DedA with SNARE-associated domain
VLASLLNVAHTVGYPVLFVAVMAESGGAPVPGETSLITGAVLASQGKLDIAFVIVIAASAAIVGDNIGYLIGRKGGRWVLQRPGPFHRQRLRVIAVGEPFFERHGPKAVFFGRFVLGLRVWASWLAGITRMRWRSFVLWNALGGVLWATAIGVIAYELGRTATNVTEAFELYGLAALLIAALGLFLAHQSHRRRMRELALGEPLASGGGVQGGDAGERLGGYLGGADGRENGCDGGEKVPATNKSRPRGRLHSDDRSDRERCGSTSP